MTEPVDLATAFEATKDEPQAQSRRVLQTETAMIIFVDPNTGRWVIDSEFFNPENEKFNTQVISGRVATYSDFHAAIGAIQHDLLIQEMVQQMMTAQASMGKQMVEQMKNAQAMQQLQTPPTNREQRRQGW